MSIRFASNDRNQAAGAECTIECVDAETTTTSSTTTTTTVITTTTGLFFYALEFERRFIIANSCYAT